MYESNLKCLFFCALQGVTKEDIERAELALQAANKGIDLAAVSANKRSSENKENKPEGSDDNPATTTTVLRKVWTDVSTLSSTVVVLTLSDFHFRNQNVL